MEEVLRRKINGIRRVFPWISEESAKKIAMESLPIYEEDGSYTDDFRSISEEEAKEIRPEDIYVTIEVSRPFYRLVHLANTKVGTKLGMLKVLPGPDSMSEPLNVNPVCFFSEDGNGVPYEELPKPIKQIISRELSSVMTKLTEISVDLPKSS